MQVLTSILLFYNVTAMLQKTELLVPKQNHNFSKTLGKSYGNACVASKTENTSNRLQ